MSTALQALFLATNPKWDDSPTPTFCYDRSVLRFSFACGLRPHAKLNPRTPPQTQLKRISIATQTQLKRNQIATQTHWRDAICCLPPIFFPALLFFFQRFAYLFSSAFIFFPALWRYFFFSAFICFSALLFVFQSFAGVDRRQPLFLFKSFYFVFQLPSPHPPLSP